MRAVTTRSVPSDSWSSLSSIDKMHIKSLSGNAHPGLLTSLSANTKETFFFSPSMATTSSAPPGGQRDTVLCDARANSQAGRPVKQSKAEAKLGRESRTGSIGNTRSGSRGLARKTLNQMARLKIC
ncbi:hypothetical protein Pelo_5068 [Pelomyxa schiedti]|nr:hypothetical protein Pelo_5068 [Pelomyxa schiedti]